MYSLFALQFEFNIHGVVVIELNFIHEVHEFKPMMMIHFDFVAKNDLKLI